MFDKSNIYDLLPFVPIASCSLFNTQNPGNACHKDPLKSIVLFAFNKSLLYYKRESMSTPIYADYQRKSNQFTTPKPIPGIPGKDKKSVKCLRHFPAIFFNEKEKQCRFLKNFIRSKHLSFEIKFKCDFVIFYVLLLCSALKYGKCVNVKSCEPAAVSWNSINEKFVIDHKTWATAAGSLFWWSLGRGFEAIILNGCVVKWLLGIFLIVNCQLGGLEVRSLVIGEILEERSLVICHWSLVGGFEAIILNGCVIAWLLGIFLIVNCQLRGLKVRSLVIGEKLEERSLVICHLSLGRGFEAIILNGCVIAWLLGNFLIVNCLP
jgi:hypothetical protein